MTLPDQIETLHDIWIPAIYRDKVRTQRTRSYEMEIAERENRAEVLFTLLGIELKVGKRRFSCPDLATARYLLVFARLGCVKIAIPYDITKISVLADELEVAWQTLLLKIEKEGRPASPQLRGRRRAALIRRIREEIADLGAGEIMPEFKTSTRQRNS
ncbi:MAG TPA: hypothetical protein PKD26_00035 [Pyrinomonadaceae bacterium]|nr:hypothetical protein [Pyrinomonadaceae bacterium]